MDYQELLRKKELYGQCRASIPEYTLFTFEQAFEIEYTHNSTAIEGNTLSLIETKVLLEDGISIGGGRTCGRFMRRSTTAGDESSIAPWNLRVGRNNDIAAKNYKKMAAKQLDWCQRNQDTIVKKANKLYTMLQSDKVSGILKRRCCDF